MPIYEYECHKCGRIHEVFQKYGDEALTTCECGGALKKLMSLNSFHLKGSGWYVTDYGRGRSKASSEKSKEKTSNKSKPETKSEAKKSD